MIRVRDDDVLISSKGTDNPLKKLQMIHEWMLEVPDKLIHVPTILVTEIQEFPEAIEWIAHETRQGRMIPEIHGLSHKDYAALTPDEIQDEMKYCQDWIYNHLGGHKPTKFYTPWGAGFDVRGAHIRPACAEIGIEVITCEHINKLNGRYGVVQNLKDGKSIDYLDGDEIFLHWWESMARLKRVVEVIKHGSWAAAKDANKMLFREET